jgi:aspartate-semialdehyde dehydrogenase
MEEVKRQAQAILNGEEPVAEAFPYPLAFNLFPHNSELNELGYCQEDMKMVNETRKIFGAPDLRISATCVRVPVLRAHSVALNFEFGALRGKKTRELIIIIKAESPATPAWCCGILADDARTPECCSGRAHMFSRILQLEEKLLISF